MTFTKNTGIALATAAAIFASTSAYALSTFDGKVVIEKQDGKDQVYELGNGNLLGLVGLNLAQIGDVVSYDILNGLVTSGSLYGIYAGGGDGVSSFDLSFGEFDQITGEVEVTDLYRPYDPVKGKDGRFFNAFWVEFDKNSKLVFGGSSTLSNGVTLDGDPLAPVPVPAGLPLLLTAIGGIAFAARRRKAA